MADLHCKLDWAQLYASLGWHVLPLAPGEKIPLIPGTLAAAQASGFDKAGEGWKDGTTDPKTIERWFSRHPEANIGIACAPSGIEGLDIDPRHGGDVLLRELLAKHGPLPKAPTVRTRSLGFHGYFSTTNQPADFHDEGLYRKGFKLPGRKAGAIDLKQKGYLVAPPSLCDPARMQDGIGGMYEWVRPPLGPNLPPLPKWFYDALRNRRERRGPGPPTGQPSSAALDALVNEIRRHGEGNRDSILYWASKRATCDVAEGCYSAASAYDALVNAGLSIGQPLHEVRRALRDLDRVRGG
jgi:hypothetical protein